VPPAEFRLAVLGTQNQGKSTVQDDQNAFLGQIEDLSEKDGRYKSTAYLFVYAALEYLVRKLNRDHSGTPDGRHVTGQELSLGIADYAREQFGPMARAVFDHWGIHATVDFGHIVYNLIAAELMNKTEEDSLDDFRDVYNFDQMFDPKRIQQFPDKLDLELM
jgi:uncharacterized repeat protein (TIGR04138 family)